MQVQQQIPFGDDNKKGKREGNKEGKRNGNRKASVMATRKASVTAKGILVRSNSFTGSTLLR
jgi:hypothetical protein